MRVDAEYRHLRQWREGGRVGGWREGGGVEGGWRGAAVCEGREVAGRVFSVKLGLDFHPRRCQHFGSSRAGLRLSSAQQTGTGFIVRTGAGVGRRARITLALQHMEPVNTTPALSAG